MSITWMVVALQVAASLQGERSVTFTQVDMQWPVVVSAEAVASVREDALQLKFSRLEVADQPANPSSIPYVSYRACLVPQDPALQLPTADSACSEPVSIMAMPQAEAPLRLPKRKLVIPLAGQASLAGQSLVLAFMPRERAGRTFDTVYAYSQSDLFGTAP